MKVIEIKKLNKAYHLGELDIPVLHGIDLEIREGEFVAVMGHSGSGKSTLLNIMGLLDKPSDGSYKLAGKEVSNYSDNELAALRNSCLGFIFQQFNLLLKLTILENTALPVVYANSKKEEHHEDSVKLLEMVGLSDRLNHRPNEVSGGQQQRAAIARALVNKPLIIFADEPTGNLDTKSAKEIMELLKELNSKGITIVMVTHETEIAAYAARTIKMQDGFIVSDEEAVKREYAGKKQQTEMVKRRFLSFIRLKDYFLEAVRALICNKMRSILSVLGVTIGVASLITMLAIGTGARKSIEDQMKQLGFNDNILMVWPDVAEKNGVYINGGMAVEFDVEDISRIKRSVSGIESVAGHLSDFVQIVAGSKNYNTKLLGASVEAADLEKLSPSIGRFFTKAEDMEQKKLALLGKTVVKKIYGSEDFNPIGQYVKINRMSFQVIGVLPVRKASRSYSDYDDLVVVPLSTAMHKLFGVKHLDDMIMRVKDGADIKETADAVRKKLLFFHRMSSSKKEVVKCWDSKELQKSVASQSRSFSFLLGSIAFISLLVGGIGIMNIMFVSVSERIKEIGLRKALGANNADILFQFIIESVFVCCVGGIIGILFGSGSSVVISKFARWTTSITSFSIWLSFCFSCFIGLIFGIWPARKASLLNPIDALRHN